MVFWSYPPTRKQLAGTAVVFITGATLFAAGAYLSFVNIAPQQARAKARSDYERIDFYQKKIAVIFDSRVLRPNRDFVEDIIQRAKPGFITDLLWSFFDHSENKARLCLDLTQAIRRAHTLIAPLQDLLHVLPLDSETDSLSSPQCNQAFDLLLKYEQLENPFPIPGSRNMCGMRNCFSNLNSQLESLIKKSNSLGVIIAKHALIALAAAMFLPAAFIPSKMEKKEQDLLQLLDAAQRGTYVLHEDIITIERLVNHLYSDIEVNKGHLRFPVNVNSDINDRRRIKEEE
ncbi:hypothetical protein M8C21_016117 [Ambrosia artemisiifolia]|uniref:Transmembrane protein n=1 Tax=Ambrosia artemisiifolia TaxID=4212 RepID=A0AAD5CF59_AMBAR|nr:hypothetical protein M8C21_016117 [Ambrosia artemisiifolia]